MEINPLDNKKKSEKEVKRKKKVNHQMLRSLILLKKNK